MVLAGKQGDELINNRSYYIVGSGNANSYGHPAPELGYQADPALWSLGTDCDTQKHHNQNIRIMNVG